MIYRTKTKQYALRVGLRYRDCVTRLVDADRALFEHVCLRCGFIFEEILLVGPRGQRKPMAPEACRLMARVWTGYGHSKGYCPLCSDPRKVKANGKATH